MTMYFFNNANMNTTAAMSMEAPSTCTNSGRTYARTSCASSIAAIVDTIAMVSIFVALVVSIILVRALGLSIILVCLISLLVLVHCHILSKEQPQPK